MINHDTSALTIEIKGVQFVNKGAELMLHAVLQKLSEIAPDAEIVLRPNKGSPYSERVKLGVFQKLTLSRSVFDLNSITYRFPRRFRNWLKEKWGIVTEADVDILLDASGFAYGDQWSSVALTQLSKEVTRFHKRSKPYVFLPQALGPFTRKQDRKKLRQSLPLARLILAREKSSHDHLLSLDVPDSVVGQFPDFTNLVMGVCPTYFNHNQDVFLVIPNSKMLSDKNSKSGWQSRYVELLSDAIDVARKQGLHATMLNHEGAADQSVCDAINQRLAQPIEIICEPDPINVKGIIGHCKLVMCSRFHGCVSALSQGVACIGTSWSYKYERLFEDYDRRSFLLTSPVDESALNQLIVDGLANVANDNRGQIATLKAESHQMWERVTRAAFDEMRV